MSISRSKFPYVSGTSLAICDRCGLKFYLYELRHDGHLPSLLVCEHCWDPRHPQLDVTGRADISRPRETRIEPADTFHFDDNTDTAVSGSDYPKGF